MIEILIQAEQALALGLLDQAESLYGKVADADPQSSIAVTGLARVAAERGDDAGAYRLARRALEIDPENAAARGLANRLAEVMRYRGDAVPDLGPVPSEPERAGEERTMEATTPPSRRSWLDRLRGVGR